MLLPSDLTDPDERAIWCAAWGANAWKYTAGRDLDEVMLRAELAVRRFRMYRDPELSRREKERRDG